MSISDVSAQFGRIDVLVNSAGVAVIGPAEELSAENWDLTMAVNLRGAFLVSQQVGRIMLAQGSGTVISLLPRPQQSHCQATSPTAHPKLAWLASPRCSPWSGPDAESQRTRSARR